jgi:hypothetical protein
MLTELSLDPLVTDTFQGHNFPGSAAANFSCHELVTDTSQISIRPDSTASDCSFDEPKTQEFRRWKDSWDEKMVLVRLKREGREWEHIIKVFWRMGKKHRSHSAWTSMWQRTAHDVSLLRRLKLNETANHEQCNRSTSLVGLPVPTAKVNLTV